MKKITLAMALFVTMGIATTEAAWHSTYEDFHSWNKPISGKMASMEEMKKYRADVDNYLREMDAEIAKIEAKKNAAINEYNKYALEYNNDDFFHQGKVALIEKKLRLFDWIDSSKKDVTVIILEDGKNKRVIKYKK